MLSFSLVHAGEGWRRIAQFTSTKEVQLFISKLFDRDGSLALVGVRVEGK